MCENAKIQAYRGAQLINKYQASESTSDSSEVPVDPEEEEIPATQSEKRWAIPQSDGRIRESACVRCVKAGCTCYQQVGLAKACYHCARQKMRCDSVKVQAPEEKRVVKIKIIKPAPVMKTASTKVPSKMSVMKIKVKRKPAPAP